MSKTSMARRPRFAETMKDEQLARHVVKIAGSFAKLSQMMKPFFLELRKRFHDKAKDATIDGCKTWDEFCTRRLDRTRRALNYFLGPKREQCSHLDSGPAAPVGTELHMIPVKIKTTTTKFNYATVHYVEPEPEPVPKISTIDVVPTYTQVNAAVNDIIAQVQFEIRAANIDPALREDFAELLAARLVAFAEQLRSRETTLMIQ